MVAAVDVDGTGTILYLLPVVGDDAIRCIRIFNASGFVGRLSMKKSFHLAVVVH